MENLKRSPSTLSRELKRNLTTGKQVRCCEGSQDGACVAIVEMLRKMKAKCSDAVKSVTFDNGKESALHTILSDELHVDTYFRHLHTSCEKGTIDNSNGILRRYLPRNTDPNGRT